ncbi:MAG: hypothetical protein ABIX01_17815 [Chitinophagaceae bacterium]
MKKAFVLTFLSSFPFGFCLAQGLGIGYKAPHSIAALEINATGNGLLIPRVATTS